MYLYIFGSFCRGEIDTFSDIDLLIVKDQNEILPAFDLDKYSIYNKERIIDLWKEGNPFAWHLYLESKLIFSSNRNNIFQDLGTPHKYNNLCNDLKKFYKLFLDASISLKNTDNSIDFDLSMIFLAIRNFASCYSLGSLRIPNFSRKSAIMLTENRLIISEDCYSILEKSRIISTRGIGENVNTSGLNLVLKELNNISNWFTLILDKIIYE